MNKETGKVLAMLEQGKLTPQQADALLAALEAEEVGELVPMVSAAERRANPELGRTNSTFTTEQIVQLAMHGVTPQYIRGLRDVGVTDLSFDELLELGIHGVKAEQVQELRALAGEELTLQQLLKLAIHGVRVAEARLWLEADIEGLSLEDLGELALHGIKPGFVQEMRE